MIYLDNAATTKPLPLVIERMSYVMQNVYANPSSLHKKGIEAENIIKEASEFFASKLGCTKEEIIYTSGGTESNNLAILGVAHAYKRYRNKLITTQIEHSSVKEVFNFLKQNGWEVYELNVNNEGYIDLDELEREINDNTALVSIMHVNNEIGTIQDITKIGDIIKRINKDTIFHVDAVQSFVKMPISVKNSRIDLLSVSGHKFYGPKGVGFLYKNSKVRLTNLFYGGGQQKNIRSGTENVQSIAGMHTAASVLFKVYPSLETHKEYFANKILMQIEDTKVNGPKLGEGAPHILSITFARIKSEVLLHALEAKDIYVSSGSACSSNSNKKKGTLNAIGVAEGAIRFSFGIDTTKEELDYVVKVLDSQVKLLRLI
ncbi:MAG: cysteine desulfurase [Epulopiscium sp. Nuni2H_MBin003]|nr:MAG: cysteine desulfurase [Epulopiscium sp. Nuni2H_MBin003]